MAQLTPDHAYTLLTYWLGLGTRSWVSIGLAEKDRVSVSLPKLQTQSGQFVNFALFSWNAKCVLIC